MVRASCRPEDRTAVLVTILLVAFLGVHRGRGDGARAASSRPVGELPGEATCLILAAGDALVAGLLGYRAASLRVDYALRDAALGRR